MPRSRPLPPPRPLARWTGAQVEHPDLVWWSRLDATYQVECQRTSRGKGRLCVFTRDGTLLKSLAVTLRFDAEFGPDIADVWSWQKRAEALVDALPNRKR